MENNVHDSIWPIPTPLMTFGFANAPPCFQRYMNKVLGPVLYRNVEGYIDDILIHHVTKAKHVPGVRNILNLLQKAKLTCNLKQCMFHQPKLEFLGVNISKQGSEMDKKKITIIIEWQKLMLVCRV